MRAGSTLLVIVALVSFLAFPTITANSVAGNQDGPAHVKSAEVLKKDINVAMEDIPMLKRWYPNPYKEDRVQNVHHHHYRSHRPLFSDADWAMIQGPPGAERGALGQLGVMTALGTVYVAASVAGAVACETAHIWVPALGRCVARAVNCVGEACNHAMEGASNVAASVRGRQQALAHRMGLNRAPRLEAPPVHGIASDNPSFRVNEAPSDRQIVPYEGTSHSVPPVRERPPQQDSHHRREHDFLRRYTIKQHREQTAEYRRVRAYMHPRRPRRKPFDMSGTNNIGGIMIDRPNAHSPRHEAGSAAGQRPNNTGAIDKGKGILTTPNSKRRKLEPFVDGSQPGNKEPRSFDLNLPASPEDDVHSQGHTADQPPKRQKIARVKAEAHSIGSSPDRPIIIDGPLDQVSSIDHREQRAEMLRLRRKGKAPRTM